MKKALLLTALAGLLLATTAAAQPENCRVGPGLASSLLFPHFEVDLANQFGVSTLLSINNGEVNPTLARVVVWTDWGVPTLAFDVYLEGLDIQTINLRNVFNGEIPSTGSGADLSGFDFCDILPPFHGNPVLDGAERAQLIADHTGTEGPLAADCAGADHGDDVARGYVTVDVVDECSGLETVNPSFTPVNTAYPYFSDGGGSNGIAVIDNRLWGDLVYIDFNQNSAQGAEAVGLWADAASFVGPDVFTFYGRYSDWDGRDDRVPLPWLWDQRFFNGGQFAGGANLIVWRDVGPTTVSRADCNDGPVWFPLPDTSFALDEEASDTFVLESTSFPLASQRVDVSSFDIPYDFGLIEINTGIGSWVMPTLTASGLYSAAFNGIPISYLCSEVP